MTDPRYGWSGVRVKARANHRNHRARNPFVMLIDPMKKFAFGRGPLERGASLVWLFFASSPLLFPRRLVPDGLFSDFFSHS